MTSENRGAGGISVQWGERALGPLGQSQVPDYAVASNRRLVAGLGTPFPLIDQLPAILAEDEFLQRMMPALDEVLAPIVNVLDCFDSYLDPWVAPTDMVRYLGSWVLAIAPLEENEQTLRYLVSTAVDRSRWRGTAHALAQFLVPHEVQSLTVEESGGVFVSSYATEPREWPDTSSPWAKITCVLWEDEPHTRAKVERMVRLLLPAHLQVEIRLIPPAGSEALSAGD